MRSAYLTLRLVCGAAALLSGCAEMPARRGGAAPGDTSVTDGLGRRVSFRHPPERVLALAPSLTEIVFAVGAGSRLVAASPADDHPPPVRTLPHFATFPLDLERVVALEPDLILATDQVNRTADADALAAAGVATYFLRVDGPSDVPRALRTAGALLGGDGEPAARLFEERVASVRAAVEGAGRPRVLVLVSDETPYPFALARGVVEAAGGVSVTGPLGTSGGALSEEWVLDAAPDVVVVLADPYDPERLVRHHPTWRELPAVRTGRVFGLHPDLVSRPGPRMAEGIARLAALLHPARVRP